MADRRRRCTVSLDANFVEHLTTYCLAHNRAPGDVIEHGVWLTFDLDGPTPAVDLGSIASRVEAARAERRVEIAKEAPCPATAAAPAPTTTSAMASAGSSASASAVTAKPVPASTSSPASAVPAASAVPKTRAMAKWGTLPGAYVLPEGHGGKLPVVGGKPIWLMQRLVEDYSRLGDLVVDPCCGAGTTAVAAIRAGRRAIVGDALRAHADLATLWVKHPMRPAPSIESDGRGAAQGGLFR